MSPYHRDLRSEADQEFFGRKRKLSPQFPDIETQLVRRQQAHETIIARILLALTAIFALATPFADKPWWMGLSALACATGFVITCFVAGNRAHVRAGGSNGQSR